MHEHRLHTLHSGTSDMRACLLSAADFCKQSSEEGAMSLTMFASLATDLDDSADTPLPQQAHFLHLWPSLYQIRYAH